MKKTTKDYTLLAIAIPVLIAIMASYPGCYSNTSAKPAVHQCSDKSHLNCDGECPCDGMECKVPVNECRYEGQECPNYNTCTGHGMAARDYQIEVYNDTVWLYDGQRLVGSYISTWKNQMDTILLNDNQ